MSLPKYFSFKHAPLSSYTHTAAYIGNGKWEIDWDEDYEGPQGGITWWLASEQEINRFFAEEDGWLMLENFDTTEEIGGNKPVVSDGGSSDYYKLTITNKAGESIECEMGDVIRCVVGDNFSLGNVYKAARRMYEASQGRGKKDVTMKYDANKIAYFAQEFADFYEGKNEK